MKGPRGVGERNPWHVKGSANDSVGSQKLDRFLFELLSSIRYEVSRVASRVCAYARAPTVRATAGNFYLKRVTLTRGEAYPVVGEIPGKKKVSPPKSRASGVSFNRSHRCLERTRASASRLFSRRRAILYAVIVRHSSRARSKREPPDFLARIKHSFRRETARLRLNGIRRKDTTTSP